MTEKKFLSLQKYFKRNQMALLKTKHRYIYIATKIHIIKKLFIHQIFDKLQ